MLCSSIVLLAMDRLIATLTPFKYDARSCGGVNIKYLAFIFSKSFVVALVFTFLGRQIQIYGYRITH